MCSSDLDAAGEVLDEGIALYFPGPNSFTGEDVLEGEVASRITTWAHISQSELRKMSGIPNTTFNRSVKARFTAEQSERLVRIIRVLDRAVELFEGDKVQAQKWLNEPARALGWKTPADVMNSEAGAWEVMKLITRLEHGVYS